MLNKKKSTLTHHKKERKLSIAEIMSAFGAGNKMLNFNKIYKISKSCLEIFSIINWMHGLQCSMVFKINFSWKAKKYIYRLPLIWCRAKMLNLARIYIFCLSSLLFCNAKLVQKVAFARYFLDAIRQPKILHVACHNLSKSDVTKTLCPIQAVIIFFTYDLIINTGCLTFFLMA